MIRLTAIRLHHVSADQWRSLSSHSPRQSLGIRPRLPRESRGSRCSLPSYRTAPYLAPSAPIPSFTELVATIHPQAQFARICSAIWTYPPEPTVARGANHFRQARGKPPRAPTKQSASPWPGGRAAAVPSARQAPTTPGPAPAGASTMHGRVAMQSISTRTEIHMCMNILTLPSRGHAPNLTI